MLAFCRGPAEPVPKKRDYTMLTKPTIPPEITAIRASGLEKSYGPFVAIRQLSFDVPAGQVAALLGPNGAGKSTTMKILTGFIAADRGSAAIGPFDVMTQRLEAAAQLGYLPENGPLYPDMTPRELLKFFG
jgi:ABC-2 type transport system ATP-binding protein